MNAEEILVAVLGETDPGTGKLRGELMIEHWEEEARQQTERGEKAAALLLKIRPLVEQLKSKGSKPR